MNKKPVITGHHLGDDGFVQNFLDELTLLTKKWGVVIEVEKFVDIYLTIRDDSGHVIGEYTTKYDYKKKEYV